MKTYIERDEWPATVWALAAAIEQKYYVQIAMLEYADGATKTVNTPVGVPRPEYKLWGGQPFADLRREADLHAMYPEFTRLDRKSTTP